MAIRKVLLPLQTAATAETALTTAIAVAKTWNAHLAVLHVEAGKQSSASDIRPTFDKMMLQSDTAVSEPNAAAGGATASFAVASGSEAEIVAFQARLADLTVVPHPASSKEVSSSEALHAVLFDSGQPVLIAPPRTASTTLGMRICLGWNGSAELASAVLAALPWLQRAQTIRILWSEEYQRRGPLAPDLEQYLAMHRLRADRAMFRPVNNVVGAGLLVGANEFDCDLLVMGAYSHSRLRQLILGGVTRYVLEHSNIPLLMHR